jgi:hypothetical protein
LLNPPGGAEATTTAENTVYCNIFDANLASGSENLAILYLEKPSHEK